MDEETKEEGLVQEKPKKKKVNQCYLDIKDYRAYYDEFKFKKMDFIVVKTAYSRVIKTETDRMIFNEKAERDDNLLKLINKVRRDGKMYREMQIASAALEEHGESIKIEYKHTDFYKMYSKPVVGSEVIKIDLKSAYWNEALAMGIVSQDTDDSFKKYYKGKSNKQAKEARLKALGALATTREVRYYFGGVCDHKMTQTTTEETKSIYMMVCNAVDQIMKEIRSKYKGVIYYYWDCVFVEPQVSQEIVKFLLEKGYNTSVERDTIKYVELAGNSYVVSTQNDISYMVRKEDATLCEWFNKLEEKMNTWDEPSFGNFNDSLTMTDDFEFTYND